MTRRRLLLLTPDFPPAQGGIQRLLAEACSGLAARGWQITVIAPSSPHAGGWDGSVPFEIRRTRSSWGLRRGVLIFAEMLRAGWGVGADFIVAGHVFMLPTALALAGRRRPVATMVYGSEVWSPRGAWIFRRLGRRCDRFVAISEFTRREIQRLGVEANRIRVAHPGGDPASVPEDWLTRLGQLGLTDDDGHPAPFLLTIARLADPHKGQDVVIRALPAIKARHSGLRYVIAGDGPLRDHLRQIAVTTGVEDSVLMIGAVSEPTKATLLKACRAFVMLSRESPTAALFEGFGIAFVEAALSGRPVLAGDSGAIPEVVQHGETGLLVDPTSPVAVTEAASRLLEDPTYGDALAAAARTRAEGAFVWPAAVDRLERVFGELAG